MHQSDLWKTPKKIYDYWMDNGYFDPCPSNPTFDRLQIDWEQLNFVNPPYSQIPKWIDKALEESKKGNISTFLVPARTDTKWFHKLLMAEINNEIHLEINYIRGRLKFNDGKTGAPFPSIYITIKPKHIYGKNQQELNYTDAVKTFLNRR